MEDKKVQVLLEGLDSQFKAFGEGLSLVRKKTEATFEAVGELQIDVTQLKDDVKVLKGDVKEIKSDIKAIKGRLTDVEHRLNFLEIGFTGFKNQLKDIKGHLISIEEELQVIRKDIKTKPEKEEVEKIEKRVVILEKKLEA